MLHGPMRNRGFAFVDIETTGVNLEKCEIIEVGGLLVSHQFEVEEEFEKKVKPVHMETAEPDALLVNGYNEEEWKDAEDLKSALTFLWSKWDGRILIGWNISFDSARLEKAFIQCGLPDPFYYKRVDVPSIAFIKLFDIPELTRFSFREVANHLGVEIKNHHRALGDSRATYDIFMKLIKPDNKLF